MTQLEQFRKLKDDFFRKGSGSPLMPDQIAIFKGLNYFAENPALRFELALERYANPDHVTMQTSTGGAQEYIKVGQIKFIVHNEDEALLVFQSVEQPSSFFIPFVDATAPAESYGAGRYLEPEEIRQDELLVDFNYCYNPYCAYNDAWSCPIPPLENRLAVRIEAGEKKFHG